MSDTKWSTSPIRTIPFVLPRSTVELGLGNDRFDGVDQ
jgi:hypothetical protein